MKELDKIEIAAKIDTQKQFFASGQTKDLNFRLKQLQRLKEVVIQFEKQILEALHKDLHKSKEEAYLTEIGIILSEVNNHIRHIKSWSKTRRVRSSMALFPSSSKIYHEPLGVALIIAPWNYPFHLLINPLIGAISAGCCAVLKTSPNAPHTGEVMHKMLKEAFPEDYIFLTQGHREVNTFLLEQPFDMIFFTGSTNLGKTVMKAAAENLIPVVLELGGKSPCIVHKDANIPMAAKRIIWGKTINAGQTCIAPDYLLVHQDIKSELVQQMRKVLVDMFGQDLQKSPFYARIVSEKAFKRLETLMKDGKILLGGETDSEERFISPTLLDEIEPNDVIMQEEIFGPLLPILSFKEIHEVSSFINARPKPLALYYFGANKRTIKRVLNSIHSGGVCINDTLMHIVNHNLPFGGVGNSGLGKYHGHDSFLAFTNRKSVVTTPTSIDIFLRYAPYKYFSLLKRLMK